MFNHIVIYLIQAWGFITFLMWNSFWILNGTFLISYIKKNKWFHSSKTCLSHGKTIAPFRLIYTFSATVARPLPVRHVHKFCDVCLLLFLSNKGNNKITEHRAIFQRERQRNGGLNKILRRQTSRFHYS